MATTDIQTIAPQIDRLVWAVSTSVRKQHRELPVSSELAPDTFGPLINLLPFRDDLTEALIRRRYCYRPEQIMTDFVADLVATELFTNDGDRLVPTRQLSPIVDEVNEAIDRTSRGFWMPHEAAVVAASADARTVLEASEHRDGLVSVAQRIEEAPDLFHRLWQRLTGLRLVRNEAHVDAWRSAGLGPADVEVLTGAWSGTALQSPEQPSINLTERGYMTDGAVTEAGLAARQEIEDATDGGVSQAFEAIDRLAFLERLRSLPPWS